MNEHLEQSTTATAPKPESPDISGNPLESPTLSPATDTEILAYLRGSTQFSEMARQTEQQNLIRVICDRLQLTVSEEEWQAAGDTFRLERRLFGSKETLAWLAKQRISAEDWSEGIRMNLLSQKLKEALFGATVDAAYVSNRDNYRRVALSQILVSDLAIALKLTQALKENPASFCQLALEHSKGKQSQEQGGFAGTRFVVELLPEIRQAIEHLPENGITEPIQTKLGYHIVKVEKWYPAQLTEPVREQVMTALFQDWLLRSIEESYATVTVVDA